jgi:hypothetical protein
MQNIATVGGDMQLRSDIRTMVDEPNVSKQATDFIDEICAAFGTLYQYVPDISCILREYKTLEEKVHSLMRHSEKLATATALLEPGTHDIEVTKNLRMCWDCHTFSEHLSRYTQRTLIISDNSFQHVFSNGKCSCNGKY